MTLVMPESHYLRKTLVIILRDLKSPIFTLGQGGLTLPLGCFMDRFFEICTKIKVVTVELAGVLIFVGVAAGLVFWEWGHIAQFFRR